MVQAVRELLIQKNIKHICITGETPAMMRAGYVKVFQTDPSYRVALLGLLAASTVRKDILYFS